MGMLLFVESRECVCCRGAATPRKWRRIPGEPNVLALSSGICWRGRGKSLQRAARAVRVCESCFVAAVIERKLFSRAKQERLFAALCEAWASCFGALVREDERAA